MRGVTTLTDRQIETLRALADEHEHTLCGKAKPTGCVSTTVVEHLRAHGLAAWSLHGARITDAGLDVIARIDRAQRVA
jgi:hypothetical protein